jgi:hypothetical protein
MLDPWRHGAAGETFAGEEEEEEEGLEGRGPSSSTPQSPTDIHLTTGSCQKLHVSSRFDSDLG